MSTTGPSPASASSILDRILSRIEQQDPAYAGKLAGQIARYDETFRHRAESFLDRFESFLISRGKDLDFGVESHLKLCGSMLEERMNFLRTGRYANSSFAEVERAVYANPEVMERHMYGLVLSQFFWREQYERLDFFCRGLRSYRGRVRRYLEIAGGHGLYLSTAAALLPSAARFDYVDISPTSMQLAQAIPEDPRIRFHLSDVLQFAAEDRYDLIVAGEILEHLEKPWILLRGIHRLLAPGGVAFLSTPVNSATLDHIYLFNNLQEIRDMFSSEGFVIESETAMYSEDLPEARAAALKIPQMFAAFTRVS